MAAELINTPHLNNAPRVDFIPTADAEVMPYVSAAYRRDRYLRNTLHVTGVTGDADDIVLLGSQLASPAVPYVANEWITLGTVATGAKLTVDETWAWLRVTRASGGSAPVALKATLFSSNVDPAYTH